MRVFKGYWFWFAYKWASLYLQSICEGSLTNFCLELLDFKILYSDDYFTTNAFFFNFWLSLNVPYPASGGFLRRRFNAINRALTPAWHWGIVWLYPGLRHFGNEALDLASKGWQSTHGFRVLVMSQSLVWLMLSLSVVPSQILLRFVWCLWEVNS